MAIVRIPYPNALPTEQNDYVRQNNLIEIAFLKIINNYTYADGNVLQGSIFQVGGTVYYTNSDTAIAGAQSEYVKLTPSGDGSTLSPAYVANLAGVTWNDTYNGYYDVGGNIYTFNDQVYFRKGDMAIGLTHYNDTTQPAIVAECGCEINGGWYKNFTEIAITGVTANDNWYDILLTPSGRTYTASFVARGTGAWSDSKQGLYSGNNRVVACVYRNDSAEFISKNILIVSNRRIEIDISYGPWNMWSGGGGVASIDVPHGLGTFLNIRSTIVLVFRSTIDMKPIDTGDSGDTAGKWFYDDADNVSLFRENGSSFDSSNYTAAYGNIFIIYEV